jgi:GntR family transcriptional regulator/MocR family aminotransferase
VGVREACRTASNTDLGYGDPAGNSRLREVLAGYLRRVRAADTAADQIIICSGMFQGLGLVLRALADQGLTRVGFEDPGAVASITATAAWAGLQAVPIPVDDRGVDVAALDATGAGAVVLTPAHQWPTGVVLAPERRLALIDWATRSQAVIIEDDYDAEFRYDRDPVGALQGLAPDQVVALGTVSKSLAPVPRLGWIAGLAAGFHAVAHLPAGTAEQEVIRAARSRSVGLYGMSTYRADHASDPPQLLFGFGNTSQRAIQTGIALISDLLDNSH